MAVVLQLTDTHLTGDPSGLVHGIDPAARLRDVLDAWRRRDQQADLVLLTGDVADDGSPVAYEAVADCLQGIGAPVLAIPGNHDLPEPLAERFGPMVPWEAAGWRIVPFDTTIPRETAGAIDVPAALAELDRLDDRPTVVAVHHPPVPRSTHPWFQLAGAAELLDGLAERPHVRAVVSGHVHEPYELHLPGLPALLSGPSTYVAISHHGDEYVLEAERPRGARVLTLGDDGSLTTELVVP